MSIRLVRPTLILLAVAGGLMYVLASSALACPFCDGGAAGRNEVRETIFGPDFWPNLLVAAAPFAVMLAIAAGIHFGPPGRRRASR